MVEVVVLAVSVGSVILTSGSPIEEAFLNSSIVIVYTFVVHQHGGSYRLLQTVYSIEQQRANTCRYRMSESVRSRDTKLITNYNVNQIHSEVIVRFILRVHIQ